MTRTITISAARGGHGASTVAASLALFSARHQRTQLVAQDPADMAALLGLPSPESDGTSIPVAPDLDFGQNPGRPPGVVVIDAGSRLDGPQSREAEERYVVVR